MSEQPASAIIIPFPKRHRAVNPVLPVDEAILSAANRLAKLRSQAAKPTGPRPLTVDPQLAGLPVIKQPSAPLAHVMSDLDAALIRQRAAMARWRTAIQDLRSAIDGLDGSLKHFRDRQSSTSSKGVSAS